MAGQVTAFNRFAFDNALNHAALALDCLGHAAFARLVFHIDRLRLDRLGRALGRLVGRAVRYRWFGDVHRTTC
ncbi:hypothetical protein GRI43_09045 [Altererythrobacter luteolus]|uniref:Uncharacterized protein n=1 Tax=Pontixanthobacter luteolus TaxID=295089 RepID=A0A6I4V0S0_9SPHN|nr:hypothetical protein [Pontixanthobacter luteolus]MXP47523.1 hypothetical protein [Pontixanthobacter luteolus]